MTEKTRSKMTEKTRDTTADKNGIPFWTTAPERRFRDVISIAPWTVEGLRKVLLLAVQTTLAAPDSAGLVLPPPKAYSSRQAAGRKDLHHNRYLEVGIVTQGEMALWWEGTICKCSAGSIIVIHPGMRYLPHVEVPGEATGSHSVVWLAFHQGCVVVHQCGLEGRVHRLSEYLSFTDAQVTGQARGIVQSIAQELAARPEHYATAVRGGLLCLFTWLLRAPVYRTSRNSEAVRAINTVSQDAFSARVQQYLYSNYHRPITLAQVARSSECSPAYLCRHFRAITGQTPFQYLRNVRIEAAKELLRSDVPISRVAEMLGFDDPLYFSRVFSQHVGEAPTSFRLRCRSETFSPGG